MPSTSEPRILRYKVVKDLVVELIARDGLQPGDRLPSSTDLASLAHVSQISVRRALDELEREGRIERHQGVGTFVARPRIVADPTRVGGLLATFGDGDQSTELATELLSLRVGMPGRTIATSLRIEPGQPVWEVVRRRSMDGASAIVERAVLPLHLVPALDHKGLAAGDSLYAFLASRYGLVDKYEEQYLEVTVPTAEERGWLNLASREQVVSIRGVSFDESGTAFDCFQQTYAASRFAFFVSGSPARRLLTPQDMDDWTVLPLAT